MSVVSDRLNGSEPSLSEINYDRMIGASHVLLYSYVLTELIELLG